jgi:hypothetical protein
VTAEPQGVPRYATRIIAGVMVYVVLWGAAEVALRGFPPAGSTAFVLLGAAFLLARVRGRSRRIAAVSSGVLALSAIGAELAAEGGHLTLADSWSTVAVACIALLLLWRREDAAAWATMLGLAALLWIGGGFTQLEDTGVLPTALAIGVVAAAGRVLGWYSEQIGAYAETEREALEWRVAQDAYQLAHQQRIEQTGLLADALLQRIVLQDGRLDQDDRNECRLLHQAIRDETRGRLLLDDAVRKQVRAHRRRGAVVQLLDDGHLSGLGPAALALLHNGIAERIAPLTSDRIIIRSGTRRGTGEDVVTIVATTIDPIAAALGEDEDEQVDLWHEFDLQALAGVSA